MKASLNEIPVAASNDVWFVVSVVLSFLYQSGFVKHPYEKVTPSRTSFP